LYGIRTNSRSDVLGLAGFVNWLEQLETKEVTILRGQWGDPLQVRKPSHLILLGDYLELWDASDAAIELSSRGIWNSLENLTCEKIYVVGNHDFASTQTLGRFPQGTGSIEILPDTYPQRMNAKTEWLKIGNTNYLLLHGHQFDQSFRYSRRGWMLVSYLRDGAEAFRLWSWILVMAAIVSSILSWFSPLFWSLTLSLFLAGALPRIILAFARPFWNHFAPRYQPIKALKGFVEWWKGFIGGSQVPSGQLCVIYGHTHLMDVFDSSEAEEATGTKLPEQLTLINIPSWVLDTRGEYQKILRDVSLYIDSNGFHLLGWDWRKLQSFYVPIDVAKRIAAGIRIDEGTVQNLMGLGWPEKLLAKIRDPPKILAQNYPVARAKSKCRTSAKRSS
jgi:UDP-2,3-diacylglucosamine pyrophosphatase LpxH